MSKKTVKELALFVAVANNYVSGQSPDTKAAYAISRKMLKRVDAVYQTHNEAVEDLRLEHAKENEAGIILRDEKGGYCYDKAGIRAISAGIRALSEVKHEIEPFYVTDGATFTEEEKEAFTGLIIEEPAHATLKKVK